MKQPFSWRRLICQMTGHRWLRSRGLDGYGRPLNVCQCGQLWPKVR